MLKLGKKKLTVKSKVWLELDEKPFIGEGRLAVLRAIDRYGSILKAAEETQISYRRVRGAIRDMEKVLGKTLVETRRGGNEGATARITESAKALIELFENQQQGISEQVDKTFNELFGEIPD